MRVTWVGEAIESGAGESFGAEDLGPLFEAEVGGEDDAGLFIRGGNDIEEEFGSGLAGGDVAELVEHEQVEFGQLLAESQQVSVLLGFAERGDQFGNSPEADLFPLGAGGHGQCRRQMRFSSAIAVHLWEGDVRKFATTESLQVLHSFSSAGEQEAAVKRISLDADAARRNGPVNPGGVNLKSASQRGYGIGPMLFPATDSFQAQKDEESAAELQNDLRRELIAAAWNRAFAIQGLCNGVIAMSRCDQFTNASDNLRFVFAATTGGDRQADSAFTDLAPLPDDSDLNEAVGFATKVHAGHECSEQFFTSFFGEVWPEVGQSLPDIGKDRSQFRGNRNGLRDLGLAFCKARLCLLTLGQSPFPLGFQSGRDEAVVGIHAVVLPFGSCCGVFEPRHFLAEVLQHLAVMLRVLDRHSFQRIDLGGFQYGEELGHHGGVDPQSGQMLARRLSVTVFGRLADILEAALFVMHRQAVTAEPAADQAGQQRRTRTQGLGPAKPFVHGLAILRDGGLIPLEVGPGDVRGINVGHQGQPLVPRPP